MTNISNLSLEKVTHDQLLKLMNIILSLGHSMMIRGGVGIGKTYSVARYAQGQAAKMKRLLLVWIDLPVEDRIALAHNQPIKRKVKDKESGEEVEKDFYLKDVYILALFDTLNKLPEDTCGIPMPNNGFVEWKPPLLFWVLSRPGAAGILFLDELLQAQQMVQKPLADLFLNKQISDIRLSEDVCVVAASNEQHDKCGTTEMLPHMKNRMSHVILLPPQAKGWVNFMQAQDKIDPETKEIIKPRIDPRIIMLVMSCPDQLYQPINNRSSDAYPTPRSWDILSDLIQDVDHEKDKETFLILVASRVGNGAAAKFQDVLNHDMSTNGPLMLKDPDRYRKADWDQKVAFTMWLSGHSRNNRKFMQGACKFLDDLGEDSMLDTMLYMMKTTVGKAFEREISGTDKYKKAREALIDMAKAVGSLAE